MLVPLAASLIFREAVSGVGRPLRLSGGIAAPVHVGEGELAALQCDPDYPGRAGELRRVVDGTLGGTGGVCGGRGGCVR